MAFRHEKEVRLIFNAPEHNENIFSFAIDPVELFDEIVLDPRMGQALFARTKQQIRNMGFTKKVIQSGLYKIPSFTIQLHN